MEKRRWEELVQGLVREGILRSPNVIRALQRVSREQFLPENMKSYAAVDTPLPIGLGQTVSAPLK
jgi:protein-L-isoaspartate(D-aspartate) O-methyltransferase